MFEQFILGIIQGIAEWLPVSSEGFIFLVKTNFFGEKNVGILLETALFLHLGTFLAALVYFRKRIWRLLKALLNYKNATAVNKNILHFLIISTVISGILGYGFISLVKKEADYLDFTSDAITLVIGLLLLVTAFLQYKAKRTTKDESLSNKHLRDYGDIKTIDGVLLGVAQSLSALPGFSRSGLTVSALLLRKFDDNIALELSFLLSLPIVLGGNIVLNADKFINFADEPYIWIGFFASFVFGLLTIDLLLRMAKKINFAHFVLFFGILTIFSAII
jgi:undecaprenyl-diphosphatase